MRFKERQWLERPFQKGEKKARPLSFFEKMQKGKEKKKNYRQIQTRALRDDIPRMLHRAWYEKRYTCEIYFQLQFYSSDYPLNIILIPCSI